MCAYFHKSTPSLYLQDFTQKLLHFQYFMFKYTTYYDRSQDIKENKYVCKHT